MKDFREPKLAQIACLLRFAELFVSVTFRISLFAEVLIFLTFIEAYHELFDFTVTLTNNVYLDLKIR